MVLGEVKVYTNKAATHQQRRRGGKRVVGRFW